MAKYSKKIVKRICDLISKDSYTIAEICRLSGISESTYYEWVDSKVEFSEKIEQARDKFDEMLVAEAKKSLVKKIKGYTVQETKTVYEDSGKIGIDGKIKPTIKEKTITDKEIQPDNTLIIFTLTNKASDEYKNRQNNEVTGKDGKDLFGKLTDEELEARIAELEKKAK